MNRKMIGAFLLSILLLTLSACTINVTVPSPEASEAIEIQRYQNTDVPMLENVIDVAYEDVISLEGGSTYYYNTKDLGTDSGFISDYVDFLKENGFSQTGDTKDDHIAMTDSNDNYVSLSLFNDENGSAYFIVTVLE